MSSYLSFASVYDRLTEDVNYEARSDYIAGFFSRCGITGGTLLDLACGTGKTAISFSKRGYSVIGVDASENMLSVAHQNALEEGADIFLVRQEMENLELLEPVDCAVCCLDSINHLPDLETVSLVFHKVYENLNDGGVFVFDVNSIFKHREILGDHIFIYDTDDVYLVWQNEYDAQTETVDIYLDFFYPEDGVYVRESEAFSERAYPVETLAGCLKAIGFTILGIYDDLTLEPHREESERIYFAVKK